MFKGLGGGVLQVITDLIFCTKESTTKTTQADNLLVGPNPEYTVTENKFNKC